MKRANGPWDCFVLSLVISSISAADITYAYGLIKSSSLISFTLYVARPDAVVVAHFSLDTFVCRLFWIAPIRSNWISHWTAKVHSHQPLFSAKKLHFEYLFFFLLCCKFDTEHIVKCIFHWICDGFLHYSQALDLLTTQFNSKIAIVCLWILCVDLNNFGMSVKLGKCYCIAEPSLFG